MVIKKTRQQQKERRKYVRSTKINAREVITRESRKYIRLGYHDNFDFTACSHLLQKGKAASLDVSQNGILFTSDTAPKLNSLITMRPHQEILKQCLQIEKLLHEDNGEIIGKVKRVTKNSSGGYHIAVAFLKQGL